MAKERDYQPDRLLEGDKEAFRDAVLYLLQTPPEEIDLPGLEKQMPRDLLLKVKQASYDCLFVEGTETDKVADTCETPDLFKASRGLKQNQRVLDLLGIDESLTPSFLQRIRGANSAQYRDLLVASANLDKAVEREQGKLLDRMRDLSPSEHRKFLAQNPRLLSQKIMNWMLPQAESVLVVKEDLIKTLELFMNISRSSRQFNLLGNYFRQLNGVNPRGIDQLTPLMSRFR